MISEIIEKWIKGILIDGITGNLSGLFDNVNAKVGEIASDVGSTPQAWNSGIFNMLRSLSETVVLPIAAAILALVMCHELIQMITEKNNMHDFDTSMFFRWIFKSAFAILIVSNTWNIVMGVFDATQSVVNQSSGVIIGETLHTGLIETEAQRIATDMKRLVAPNSPDKNHFMVEVSPYFTKLASSRDTDQLIAMLPYKSLRLSSVKDRFGIYALVDKKENRDRGIRKPRTSVRKQLSETKQAASPKKAAARSKQHEMEV